MPAFNAKYSPFAELSFDNFTLGQAKKHIVPWQHIEQNIILVVKDCIDVFVEWL